MFEMSEAKGVAVNGSAFLVRFDKTCLWVYEVQSGAGLNEFSEGMMPLAACKVTHYCFGWRFWNHSARMTVQKWRRHATSLTSRLKYILPWIYITRPPIKGTIHLWSSQDKDIVSSSLTIPLSVLLPNAFYLYKTTFFFPCNHTHHQVKGEEMMLHLSQVISSKATHR